jgi:four helix bundle protein
VREAQGAESKGDFRHKCKIAYKGAEESEYWLLLCKHVDSYPFEESLLGNI